MSPPITPKLICDRVASLLCDRFPDGPATETELASVLAFEGFIATRIELRAALSRDRRFRRDIWTTIDSHYAWDLAEREHRPRVSESSSSFTLTGVVNEARPGAVRVDLEIGYEREFRWRGGGNALDELTEGDRVLWCLHCEPRFQYAGAAVDIGGWMLREARLALEDLSAISTVEFLLERARRDLEIEPGGNLDLTSSGSAEL